MEYLGWLYLATRLDAIHGMFVGMIPIGLGALAIVAFAGALFSNFNIASKDSVWYWLRWWRRGLLAVAIVGVLGQALVPTKKDAMFIAAGVGVIEASKALAGSEVAKTSVKIVEQWLQNQLENEVAKALPKKDEKK
jgi:hypothetical protein